MSKKSKTTEVRYAARRKEVIKRIKGEAAIFSAAPEVTRSHDQLYSFRQNSDFLYLTGLSEPDSILVLLGSSKGPRSVLFLRERDPIKERWAGEILGLKRAKRRFDVDEIREISEFEQALPQLLEQSRVLHYALGTHPQIDFLIFKYLQKATGPRATGPHTLKDSRLITSQMRVVKDKQEIASIRHAADITTKALLDFLPSLREVKSERHGAKVLDSQFARLGADGPAFPTVVASGKNATFLHHEPRFQPLWKRELVLIDAGASFNGYGADITRTVPVSGTFSEAQAQVYDLVFKALASALEFAKPGSSLEAMHQAAVRTLTAGLVDLGILRGPVAQLVQNGAYRPYFMHRIGHWLGIDVHDIAPIYQEDSFVPPFSRPFEPGNVFTIEPGLYFEAKDQTLPVQFRGIGVRIEDDVLITSSGHEVLTDAMPTSREDIETLLKAIWKL